jgi:hypothetical protein
LAATLAEDGDILGFSWWWLCLLGWS